MSSTTSSRRPALPQITYTQTIDIPRASSLEEFREKVREGKPVAYTIQEDERFPAFEKWSKEEYFSNSQIQVQAHQCTTTRTFDVVNSSVLELAVSAIKHTITLGQYVRNMERHRSRQTANTKSPIGSQVLSGTEMYMRHNFCDQEPWKELLFDIDNYQKFIPIADPNDIRTIGFWLSGGGMSTQMHFDNEGEHNMNYQICGRKLITLYAPKDGIQNLYPLPGRGAALSLVDPYNPPDLKRFPRVLQTQPHVIELKAGEVLFIPSRWWHDIRHLDDWNINVTAWFQEGRGKVRDKYEGPWFTVTWSDTLVAWFYVLKVVMAKLVLTILLAYASLRLKFVALIPQSTTTTNAKKNV